MFEHNGTIFLISRNTSAAEGLITPKIVYEIPGILEDFLGTFTRVYEIFEVISPWSAAVLETTSIIQ